MAPWSQRHAPPPRPPPLRRPSADVISRIHSPSSLTAPPGQLGRLPDYVLLDNSQLHAADESSSESDFHPRRPRRPTHSRSMSHPFPALFSKKKRPEPTTYETDSDSDDAPVMTKPLGNTQKNTHKRGGANGSRDGGSRDFATGNCMTCGSLVRWPRDLRVFKCTVCLTINDLPPDQQARANAGPKWLQRPSQDSTSPQKQPPRPADRYEARPVSLDQTKRLIRQCIRNHLTRAIRRTSSFEDERREVLEKHLAPSHADNGDRPCTSRQMGSGVHRRQNSHDNRPAYLFPEQPTLHPNPQRVPPPSRSFSSSYPERPPSMRQLAAEASGPRPADPRCWQADDPKRIFKPLEDYIMTCFNSFHCVNSSFLSRRPAPAVRSGSESAQRRPSLPRPEPRHPEQYSETPIIDLDPKLLLLGDFAENGTWWTGSQSQSQSGARHKRSASHRIDETPSFVTPRSAQVEWNEVAEWYRTILNAAESWMAVYEEMNREAGAGAEPGTPVPDPLSATELRALESQLLHGQEHTHRALLKATENLLKRPGRPMTDPEDLRFLLIVLENPLLHGEPNTFQGQGRRKETRRPDVPKQEGSAVKTGPVSGQHSVIIKRILGLISNSSNTCQNHLITWFARYTESRFIKAKDLAAGFLTYRLIRQNEKKQEVRVDITAGLIPNMSAGNHSAASLHAALGTQNAPSKKQKEQPKKMVYNEDWQIKAAARVLALIFAANNMTHIRRPDQTASTSSSTTHRGGIQAHGQIIPTSDFYNTMIDYTDLVAEFEAWESKRGRFSFCQYPFLLSMWAKSQVLEHDARRQQMTKARDAFFDSIMTRRAVTQFLVLDVRRECLVDDSLKAVSEVIGSGSEDIKKGLRIVFKGEEGLDAGGLKKEWFLLLVREVFNPDHGMFIYDEDSQFCYFNPNSFETSDQYFLVGVVMGLAIYNSTILDVALPPFAFRKLLASAPSSSTGPSAHPRPSMNYTLEDLAEYRPRLAAGLRQLLEFDGDVEETFQLDFVVDVEKYGIITQVPLCPGGERKAVTNANKWEYVNLYVRYLLETAVTRQFEPFKRGFYTVCGGNALSLFRPEEIELLVRGSDTALDVDALRGVAEYDNWGTKTPDGVEPVVGWFWETFKEATPDEQRKLLSFITGTDRVPAMGAALLPIKITCLGEDENRYPIARTCFNMLSLRRYGSRERLEQMLWTAVHESEGFGLK
ncbi:putative E3 ubiquitin-protein ligase mug30 [Colletotrichum siamense]|nr:putative E3 ubiquitin-protein ligase mug30 [Colletotrichum siamense]